ncbi:MAG: branched-chain amino acid ABC transporter permease [Desulfobacteraceae bacterium]|nr:MAG: branched-chain amino acid ABC transporter permease [Desulfobacteraceae bacterium]
MTLQTIIDLLMSGLCLGGIYSLMAFSLSISLATTRVLNIAHGGFLILGAAFAMLLTRYLGLSLIYAVPIFIICWVVFGSLFEFFLVKPLIGKSHHDVLIGSILITFGFTMALDAFLSFYWAKWVDPTPTFSLNYRLPPLHVFGYIFSGTRTLIVLFAASMILCFHLLLKYSTIGKAARAISEDAEGALITGINPQGTAVKIYILATLTAATAGAFYVLLTPLSPFSSFHLTLVALTVIVIGGVGSLPGALAGGILLGIAEVMTAFFLSPAWSPTVYLLIFFFVLVVKKEGLMGAVN